MTAVPSAEVVLCRCSPAGPASWFRGPPLVSRTSFDAGSTPTDRSTHMLGLTLDLAPFDLALFGAEPTCRITRQPFVGASPARVVE